MSLNVFGMGFGRTGTESLKTALEILGQGPCYHMFEVLPLQERVDTWVGLIKGEQPDWDATFAGYNASVDWPGAHFWKEIAAHNPDAKLILTIRDAEQWYESIAATILPLLRSSSENPDSLANRMFISGCFEGNIDDRSHVIDVFNRHNAAVRAAFGPDRLLVYDLGSGWEPLCAHLGLDVPDVPYPHGNSADEFDGNITRVTASADSQAA